MTQSPKDAWNQRYSEEGFAYGHEPNDFFKSNMHHIPQKGKVLFIAEGEGRNAVYAASQGFESVAFDISEAGKRKAEHWMKQCQTQIEYHIADLNHFDFGDEQWDAIIFVYSHFPKPVQQTAFTKTCQALKKNGVVILECFSEKHLEVRHLSNVGGPADRALLYDADEVRLGFSALQLEYLQEELIELNEGKYHQGRGWVIRGIFRKV